MKRRDLLLRFRPGRKVFRERSLVASLLLAGFLLQANFLARYPQPILFGDPGAYHRTGQEFRRAWSELGSGHPLSEVVNDVRGYLYFTGVGVVYGCIDSMRGLVRTVASFSFGDDLPDGIAYWLRPRKFFGLALAGFNCLAMLGAFLLARTLARSFAAGFLTLVVAIVYPSFSVQLGRLFPEPIFGCLFVWSAYLYARAIASGRWSTMALSGMLLSGGFFVRAQLMEYFPLLLAAALLLSMPFWVRTTGSRKLALALALACLPSILAFRAIVSAVGDDLSVVENFGFFAFQRQQSYPYGFWMYLDSDGWVGPYGIKTYPFYKDMVAEASERDPNLMRSKSRQLAFTARYVTARAFESTLLILDNLYRMHVQPANDFRWEYILSERAQAALATAIIVMGLAGLVVVASERFALTGVYVVPVVLGMLYALSFPRARYVLPGMLVWMASASVFCVWSVGRWTKLTPRARRVAILAVGLLLVALLLGWSLRSPAPELARAFRLAGGIGLGLAPIVAAGLLVARSRSSRWIALMTALALVLVSGAHAGRDRRWHEVTYLLPSERVGLEQEIHLSGYALNRLRAASEAFAVFDLRVATGSLDRAEITINGIPVDANKAFPAMPAMGESTLVGGRNPRRYRQWWAVPLPADLLPARAPAVVTVSLRIPPDAGDIVAYGDRFRGQQRIYEGPSFGEWPRSAAAKLEYNGDYRLPARYKLQSARTRSFLLRADGSREELRSIVRGRLLTLGHNQASVRWQSDALSTASGSVVAFFAYSRGNGNVSLLVDGTPALDFRLSPESEFQAEAAEMRLCYQVRAPRGDNAYGGYVITLAHPAPSPLTLEARYVSGMSLAPKFFTVDEYPSTEALDELLDACGVSADPDGFAGANRLLDAAQNSYPQDTGRWTVANVY